MKSNVKIPTDLLSKFQDLEPGNENGIGEPGIDESFTDANELEILESLNDTLSWICETGDSIAKNQGYPGLGEVPPEQLGDLLTIVAKRNLPGSIIEKSPETALVAILGGIGVQNYLAFQNRRKQEPEPESPEKNNE